MAKRKNSRALFEVINQSKGWQRPPRNSAGGFASAVTAPRPGALAVPRWWFNRSAAAEPAPAPAKNRLSAGEAPSVAVIDEADAAPNPAQSRSFFRDDDHRLYSSSYSAAPMTIDPRAIAEAAPPAILPVELTAADPARPIADDPDREIAGQESQYASATGSRPLEYAAGSDAHQRQIKKMVISAASGLAAVLMIVLIARHFTGNKSTALGSVPTSVLRAGPAHPEVMNIRRTAGAAERTSRARSIPVSEAGRSTPTFNEPHPPIGVVSHDGNRAANLNYVVAQSYPLTEMKMAQEACDFLTRGGVPCTIERDVHGWSNKLAVVGIDGFSRLSSPEYRDYLVKIEKLSAQFAPNRSFKAFRPSAVKWGRS